VLGDLLAGEAEVGEAVRRMVESYES